MLPSPSFNIPSIGTPHHAMEEDAMINPQAQAAQQNRQIGHGSITQTHSTSNLSQQNSFRGLKIDKSQQILSVFICLYTYAWCS